MNIYCHALLDEELRNRLTATLSPSHQVQFRAQVADESEAIQFFKDAHYILGNPPVRWFENIPDNLRFWQLDSAGFDQYASIVLPEHVKVANMGDWFARPCAETIVGGVVALYRGLHTLTLLKEKQQWIGADLRLHLRVLYQQNVIILGAGTIGKATQAILKGFGSHTHLFARTSPEANLRTLEELYHELGYADLVINTLPGTADKIVNASFFQAMKKGAVYANVGRGNTTDEEALIEALNSQHLSGAVLDVTEIEPLPASSPLWHMAQVLLTQHTGGGRQNEHLGKVDLFLNNLFALENGSEIVDQITLTKGY